MRCSKVRRFLDNFAAGETSQMFNTLLKRHIQTCPDCAREMQLVQEARQLLATASPVKPGPQFSAAWRQRVREAAGREPSPRPKFGYALRLRPLLPALGAAVVILGIGWAWTWWHWGPQLQSSLQAKLAMEARQPSAFAAQQETRSEPKAPTAGPALYRLEITDFGPNDKAVQRIARNFRANHGDGTYYALRTETVSLTTFDRLSAKDVTDLRAALERAGATIAVQRENPE